MFVHGALDDAGLPKLDFRLYGHIRRRGECKESLENMARYCHTNVNKVQAALANLLERHMITKETRIGYTAIYRVTPLSAWVSVLELQPNGALGLSQSAVPPPPKDTRGLRQSAVQSASPEVNPVKAFPLSNHEHGKKLGGDALAAAGDGKNPKGAATPGRKTPAQLELLFEIEKVIPDAQRQIFPRLAESDPDTLRRAFDDLRERMKFAPRIRNPGGYLVDTFKRFRGRMPAKKVANV